MPDPLSAFVYVDGQYVRRILRDADRSDEFDPTKPGQVVQNQRIAARQVIVGRTFYYDAIDLGTPDDEQERQQEYFKRVSRLPDTHVVLGQVKRGSKKKEQKGVDVQLAVDSLRAATSGVTEVIALATGDADFVPLVRAIREAGPHVFVFAFKRSLAEDLESEADRVYKWDEPPSDWDLG